MNIGISCYPTFGGSGVVASELGMELARDGHQVHIISYAPPVRISCYHPNLHFHKVEISDYPLFEYPPYSLALASRLVEVARSEHLDLIHAHYAIPHAVSAFLAQEMLKNHSLPFITTLHGTDITLVGNAPSFWPITHFILEKSDAVTAVSRHLRDETCRVFNVCQKVEVIPNFVPRQLAEKTVKIQSGRRPAAEGEAILAHISNFRPVKRIRDVVEIFARVRRHRPAKLLMVGDGPERGYAERQAEELGVHEDVYFLGMQQEVEEVLGFTDVFLLPSQTESFGLVALEASALGVPVVASCVGGLPEVVEDGKTGFLLAVGDVEGMADAALRLLNDPALRREMGLAARRRALESFSADRIRTLYTDLYLRVLQATKS